MSVRSMSLLAIAEYASAVAWAERRAARDVSQPPTR
jgi:hypothetical protein